MKTNVLCTKMYGLAVDYGEGITAAALFVVVVGWLVRNVLAMPYEYQSAIATVGIFALLTGMLSVISYGATDSLYELWFTYRACGYWTAFIAQGTTLIGCIIAPIAFVVYLGVILHPYDLAEITALYVGFGITMIAVYGVFRCIVSGKWYAR